ncbi:hypothetical protein M885DRAFT_622300 [Pelagophyceae sp. CCMP2097]|nr:hypothetical protein M885DRAFT_622300 [Pelagophyceae sp. CCMP2097]
MMAAGAGGARGLGVLGLVLVLGLCCVSGCGARPSSAAIEVVGLVAPMQPWDFGPYQQQCYLLSKELHRRGFAVVWLATSSKMTAPRGKAYAPDRRPPGFDDAHLTYVGLLASDDGARFRVSAMNDVAKTYGVDAFIAHLDAGSVLRDADFAVPAIAWLPYHFTSLARADLYNLLGYTGIANLAPSSAEGMRKQLERRGTAVQNIPLIVDVAALEALAAGEAAAAQCAGEAAQCAGEGRGAKPFVVLMQGGNYEALDRKGWASGLRAFKLFHDGVVADGLSPPELRIHAISSRAIASAENGGAPAPAAVLETGLHLRYLLDLLELSPGAYTLEDGIVSPAAVAFMKAGADVCLHGSKTEGFGMNVLECQALGTPVVTTKFLAMEDYTFYGEAVEPAALEVMYGGLVAVPDARGAAAALRAVYDGADAGAAGKRSDAVARIRRDFSAIAVGDAFVDLLRRAPPRPRRRTTYATITDDVPRPCDWFDAWTILAPRSAVLDHGGISRGLDSVATGVDVVLLPYDAPFRPRNESEVVAAVRTYAFRNAQQVTHLRASILSVLGSKLEMHEGPAGLVRHQS